VVVDLGEADVLVGKQAQVGYRRLDALRAVCDAVQ
jgi:hypothetical protein